MNFSEKASQLAQFASELRETVSGYNPDNPEDIINKAYIHNKWFTPENIIHALNSWAETLQSQKVETWLGQYSFSDSTKKVALILAGNIPAVGFHDVLCTLLSGHHAIIKLSSEDKILIPFLLHSLEKFLPGIRGRYSFEEEMIKDFDAVIATGSNNSERYFKKYFSRVPHIIRHNRNSIAVLNGSESKEELLNLKEDIFRYFGLGCRNVSMVLIPEDYNWKAFLDIINEDLSVLNHNAYANNLTYYTAYFSLMDEQLLDGGTVLLRKNAFPASPPAVLHFYHYKNDGDADMLISGMKDSLQCVVRKDPKEGEITFGRTQKPAIDDYADNVDTMKFLSSL